MKLGVSLGVIFNMERCRLFESVFNRRTISFSVTVIKLERKNVTVPLTALWSYGQIELVNKPRKETVNTWRFQPMYPSRPSHLF